MNNNYKFAVNLIFILSILRSTYCLSNDIVIKPQISSNVLETKVINANKLCKEAIISVHQIEASNKDNFGTKMIEASSKFGLDGAKELAASGKSLIISTVVLVVLFLLAYNKSTIKLNYRPY